jgi:hypothetical protein
VPDSKWNIGSLIEPKIEVPDSIGGNRLKGYIALSIKVHKTGKLLGYKICQILVGIDTTKPAILYSSVDPPTIQGDSLIQVFTPFIDKYYHSLDFKMNNNNPYFVKYDTLSMLHDIQFNSTQ